MENRSINYAYDTVNRKVINVTEAISSQKEGFELRGNYNSDTGRFYCVECEQRLVVSHSSKDNVYFRHLPNSKDCLLKDNEMEPDLLTSYKENAFAREGVRHIYLKNKIGELLKYEEGVNYNSIDIDSKFIVGADGQKRRPDVYCEYHGHKLAFEIQISYLPLHYTTHRYEFYKRNGIYLIWIIDFFNSPKDISTFQRDIKYIWQHQNLFKLDETEDLRLLINCHFKQPFIYQNEAIHEIWTEKKIQFRDLKFDKEDYSCYYLHYEKQHAIQKDLLIELEEKIKKDQSEEQARKRKLEVDTKLTKLLSKITHYRKNDYNFYSIIQSVNELDEDCTEVLNIRINLDRASNGIPIFLIFFKEYVILKKEIKMTVVEFLLSCPALKFDINAKDNEGKGIIQYLYGNPSLDRYLYRIKPLLFQRSYKVNPSDRDYLISTRRKEGLAEYYELTYYSACDTLEEIKIVKDMVGFLLFVDSAKRMEIIRGNVKSWVSYTITLLTRYKEYWKYTRAVLNKTRLGAELKRVDSKGTIKRKIKEFGLQETDCAPEVYSVLIKVHPDIFIY